MKVFQLQRSLGKAAGEGRSETREVCRRRLSSSASTDANGNVTTNTYNQMGWLRTITLPGDSSIPAHTVTCRYEKMENITNTRDTLNREQIYTYDNRGRIRTAADTQLNRIRDAEVAYMENIPENLRGGLAFETAHSQ
jgi:YD repeat-containing protein